MQAQDSGPLPGKRGHHGEIEGKWEAALGPCGLSSLLELPASSLGHFSAPLSCLPSTGSCSDPTGSALAWLSTGVPGPSLAPGLLALEAGSLQRSGVAAWLREMLP